MAEALGLIAAYVSLAGISWRFKKAKAFKAAYNLARDQQAELLARTYGPFKAVAILWLLPETASRYETLNRHIIQGTGEAAMSFRQATTDECNMTAVAGAIIAQVSITALSLPFLSNTHWTARACFLLATTSGCLSVYYACVLQRIIGALYNAEQIREWLMLSDPIDSSENDSSGNQAGSLAAVLILSAPFVTVKVSIFSFVLGLAIYQGFVFTKSLNSDSAPSDDRNNFIILILGTGVVFVFFLVTFSLKKIEGIMRSSSFREMDGLTSFIVFGRLPESKEEGNSSTRMAPAETLHEREQTGAQQGTVIPQTHNLAALLEAAAQAHAQCAEADRRVALAFSGSSTS